MATTHLLDQMENVAHLIYYQMEIQLNVIPMALDIAVQNGVIVETLPLIVIAQNV